MLFSLFARKNFQTRQDGELAKWQGTIRNLEVKKPTFKIPFLRPYQVEGVTRINQLHSLGCHPLLADEMGLGKTIQALATLSTKANKLSSSLVVCPASVVPVWIKEVKSHFPKIKTQILRQEITFKILVLTRISGLRVTLNFEGTETFWKIENLIMQFLMRHK